MPHSSGGGSRSGGSHGGSVGRHSYSGTRGGEPASTVSRTYFPGSRRYRYTTRSGRTRFYYVSGDPEKVPLAFVIIFALFVLAAAFFISRNFARNYVFHPRALNASSYASGVSISDETGLLHTDRLENAMREFLDATGVSPAMEIVYRDSCPGSLQQYAYGRYIQRFGDEYHWLVVLSLPRDFSSASDIDWRWEGMIGDDCAPAISTDMERRFTNVLQRHLNRAKGDTLASELAKAWSELARKAVRTQVDPLSVFSCGLPMLVCVLLIRTLIRTYTLPLRLEQSILDEPEPAPGLFDKTVMCEYCGAKYDPEVLTRCPGCGASIRKEE